MSNELDELMARLDADPTLPHPGDIDALIAYYRKGRVSAGTRAKKAEAPTSAATTSYLDALITKVAPKAASAGPTIKRRM